MKELNTSNKITIPKKMEKLLKFTQDLTIDYFSKTQKQIIHNNLTLSPQLTKKRTYKKTTAVAKLFKSTPLQIIYNIKNQKIEFSCNFNQNDSNKLELVDSFDSKRIETQIERILLTTITLEDLLSKLSDSEINEIFKNQEFVEKREYYKRKTLAFKNKAGFEKVLNLIVLKIKQSFKKTYLSFMKSQYSENLPLYFSKAQLEKYKMNFLVNSSGSYNESIVTHSKELFYQFVKKDESLKPLKIFAEDYIVDFISNNNLNYEQQKGISISDTKLEQMFSILGPIKGLDLIKNILEPFYQNLNLKNFDNLEKILENLFDLVTLLCKFDESFKKESFEDFYLFFSEKLMELQSVENKGENCFILNRISLNHFMLNSPKTFTVNLALIGYWETKLLDLLFNGFDVKVKIFDYEDSTLKNGLNNLLELNRLVNKATKDNYLGKVLVSKNELEAIKILYSLWFDKKPEIEATIQFFEDKTY